MPLYSLDQLMRFIWPGLTVVQSMYVAAKLGIADLLAARPRTAEELAREIGADSASLKRLLAVLETVGLCIADRYGVNRNTASGEFFRSDHPASVRGALLTSLSPPFWRSLGELEATVRTGQPSFEQIYGERFFDWLSENAEEGRRFAASMNAATMAVIPPILAAWDFSRYTRIVDVGGGQGALLACILSAYPHLQGVLYDLPAVTACASALLHGPLAARCQVIAGDFFDSVPELGDAYLLRSVIHDWNDQKSLTILRNCRRAMQPGRTLLVLEQLLERGSQAELLDLHMMVLTGGRERSLDEYRALLQAAGFETARVIYTAGPAIIENLAV